MQQSSPSALEAKTLLYWTLQMHWNNKTHVLQARNPFCKMPTVQSAIQDCNAIMADMDPKRPVSQLAFKLQSHIINKPDPTPDISAAEALIGKTLKIRVKDDKIADISA